METKLELKAPEGKIRVIAVDTFAGEDWIVGDYDTYAKARFKAEEKGGVMLKTHVYDDKGKHLFEA